MWLYGRVFCVKVSTWQENSGCTLYTVWAPLNWRQERNRRTQESWPPRLVHLLHEQRGLTAEQAHPAAQEPHRDRPIGSEMTLYVYIVPFSKHWAGVSEAVDPPTKINLEQFDKSLCRAQRRLLPGFEMRNRRRADVLLGFCPWCWTGGWFRTTDRDTAAAAFRCPPRKKENLSYTRCTSHLCMFCLLEPEALRRVAAQATLSVP